MVAGLGGCYEAVTVNAVLSSALESPPMPMSKVEVSMTQSRTAFQYPQLCRADGEGQRS